MSFVCLYQVGNEYVAAEESIAREYGLHKFGDSDFIFKKLEVIYLDGEKWKKLREMRLELEKVEKMANSIKDEIKKLTSPPELTMAKADKYGLKGD